MESDTNECVIIQCNKKKYWKERTGHLLRKKATEFAQNGSSKSHCDWQQRYKLRDVFSSISFQFVSSPYSIHLFYDYAKFRFSNANAKNTIKL